MRVDVLFKIRNDPKLYSYLRENSYWYKFLNRDPNAIKYMEEEMKERYKLTPSDKINEFSEKLNLISSFMELIK